MRSVEVDENYQNGCIVKMVHALCILIHELHYIAYIRQQNLLHFFIMVNWLCNDWTNVLIWIVYFFVWIFSFGSLTWHRLMNIHEQQVHDHTGLLFYNIHEVQYVTTGLLRLKVDFIRWSLQDSFQTKLMGWSKGIAKQIETRRK